jgi:uncharacterized membrane protein YkoI
MTEHEPDDVWRRPEVVANGPEQPRSKKLVWGAGLVAGGALVGAVAAGTLPSLAASPSPSPSSTAAPGAPGTPGTAPDDHHHHQGGSGETPLTGTTADKVRAAALAKVPGATVDRVETDNGGVYEAHLTKPDGTHVTVKVDASFQVTAVETGGPGGHHEGGPGGAGGPGGQGWAGGPGGGHDETPLTGDTATKVRTAALAAVPGATVDRLETDHGGVYEAHLTRPDGTHVTVKVDAGFHVTKVETGR